MKIVDDVSKDFIQSKQQAASGKPFRPLTYSFDVDSMVCFDKAGDLYALAVVSDHKYRAP
jgi:hypothetical protein